MSALEFIGCVTCGVFLGEVWRWLYRAAVGHRARSPKARVRR